MPDNSSPADQRKRFAELIKKPDTLDVICAHVSNNGTLITLCDTWNIPFGIVSNWLRSDPEREKRYRQALNDRTEWGKERVLLELRHIAFLDIRGLFTETGKLRPISEWPEDIARSLAGIEIVEEFEGSGQDKVQSGWNKKVKLLDKVKALELLGKNLALFNDKVEHTVSETLADIINKSFSAGEKK